MANGADGSIVIDTTLDNTGFERGSQRLEQAVKGVTDSLNGIGKQVQNAIGGFAPVVNQAGQTLRQSFAQASTGVQDMAESMDQAMTSGGFAKGMNEAQRACTSLANQLTRLGDAESMGVKTETQMKRFQLNVDRARASVQQLQMNMARLGSQQVATQEYEQLASSIQKAEVALFKLYDRRDIMQEMNVDQSSAQWQRLDIQIRNAEQTLARYERQMEGLHASGGATMLGSQSMQFQQMSAQLQQMMGNLQHYEQVAAGFNVIASPAAQSQRALEGVDRELQQKPKDAVAAAAGMSKFGSALRTARSTAMQAIGALAKMPFKALSKGFSGVVNAVKRFSSHSHNASMTSQGLVRALTNLRRMLISRLKEQFITSLMDGMRDAMQALAAYSSSFNASMSSITNSMKGMSANLAVSLGSLVNAIAPALSSIIGWLSQAISYLNAFFALLSGKSSVTVAKKQTDSYADSLKSAGGAASDLKKQVYGFDQLNKAQSDSGGGGGGSGAGDMYEDVPISSLLPDSIAGYFESIKAAFLGQRWEELGGIIADGMNYVVSAVDNWIVSTFHPAAVMWAGNIAQTLNGLVGGFDWMGLSIMVADGANAILDTLNTFLTTFDFTALGVGLGTSITGLFAHIDWDLAGRTVASGINMVINTLLGAVTSINWSGMGTSLATGLMSAVNGINWTGAGQTINTAITGLFQTVNAFMSGMNWGEVGAQVGRIVSEMDIVTWLSEAGTLLSSLIEGIYQTISGFITAINWQQLGSDLWNGIIGFLASFDWSGVVSSAFEYLGAVIGGSAALVLGFVTSVWESIKAGFESIKETYFAPYFNEYGQMTIEGFFQGILDMLTNIGQWVIDHIFTPFINGFKAAFGIASPSTVMKEQGGYIIDGLLQGITAAWESIVTWVTGVVEEFAGFFSGLWDTISGAASTAWEGIKTTITGVWDGISTAASTTWNTISTTVTGVWDGLSTAATQTWNSISTTITTLWTDLSTSASTTWEGIKTSVSTWFTDTWTSLSGTAESIKTGLSNAWDSVSTTASTTWESISTTVGGWFSGLWTNITGTAGDIQADLSTAWESVKTTASTAWEGLKTTVTDLWTGLKTTLQGTSWTDVGDGITSGVKQGITDGWSTFKTWVSNKFSNLVSSVKNTLGIHSPSTVFASIGEYLMEGLNVGVLDGEGKVLKTVSNIAGAITNGMSIDSEINAGGNYAARLDLLTDKLSNVASVFVTIADALTAIGGFHMPAVAAGTVIPYRARVAAESPSTGKSDPLATFTNNFDETMSDQRDILQRIAERLDRLELKIDGDSLTQAITRRQRSHERSYGY